MAINGWLALSETGKGFGPLRTRILCWLMVVGLRYRSELQNILAEVPVGNNMVQLCLHHILINKDFAFRHVFWNVEHEFLKEVGHNGMQPPRSNILHTLVDNSGGAGNLADGSVGKLEIHPFRSHQSTVLFDEGIAWLGENKVKILFSKAFQFNTDRETALKLRYQVRGFCHMESS